MQALFAHCYALTNLDVSSFDTARVTDMAYIFYNCKSIREIDIRNFDTALVTSGKCMFLNCENLRTLYFDVYKFRTGIAEITAPMMAAGMMQNLRSILLPSLLNGNLNGRIRSCQVGVFVTIQDLVCKGVVHHR